MMIADKTQQQLLAEIGQLHQRITKYLRRTNDLPLHLKDDRLACILVVNDSKDIEFIAEEIRAYIESLAIEHPGNSPLNIVTVSLGYTICHWQ
jgi:PleD family two-component response regulator